MNNAGGFLLNPQVAADGQPNFLDRTKVDKLPISLTDDNTLKDFIWAILIDRENFPENVEKELLSDEVKTLTGILETKEWTEIDIHFDEIRLGGPITLFAKLIELDGIPGGDFTYKGRAIAIKRFS